MHQNRRAQLQEQLRVLEVYLRMKIEIRDWHGVADAAMDIREIEAQLKLMSELNLV